MCCTLTSVLFRFLLLLSLRYIPRYDKIGDESGIHAAMAVYGKINEYEPTNEDWSQYAERLGHYFAANEIESGEKKRAVLLTVVGAATYKLLRSLVAPAKPGEKSYDELITTLSAHFNPSPSPIMRRFKFNTRCKQPGESVAVFVTQLRSLSEDCQFGDSL